LTFAHGGREGQVVVDEADGGRLPLACLLAKSTRFNRAQRTVARSLTAVPGWCGYLVAEGVFAQLLAGQLEHLLMVLIAESVKGPCRAAI